MAKPLFKKIAVIGVGLLGGSILLASRSKKLAKIYAGWDINQKDVLKASQQLKFSTGSLESVVKDADLVVLCTPVEVMKQITQKLIPFLNKKTIVTDVGSVKSLVDKKVSPVLKGKALWVPSHPMAGSEKSGWKYSVETLFLNAAIILTPKKSERKSLHVLKVESFWKKLGGRTYFLDPKEHDHHIALVSHLPHLVAYNLVNVVDKRTIQLAGKGFKDTTRVAQSSACLWEGILVNNREETLKALGKLEKSLKESRLLLKNKNSKKLLAFLKKNQLKRKKIA
jgi:prephenate dehydrogenase